MMIKRISLISLGLVLLVPSLLAQEAGTAEQDKFVYNEAPSTTFVVTAVGLSRVRVKNKMVAKGGWYGWNLGPTWFGKKGEPLKRKYYVKDATKNASKAMKKKTLKRLSENKVRVVHDYGDVKMTFTYTFQKEDVIISARIDNYTDSYISFPAFGGLRFEFASPPGGRAQMWHPSYLSQSQDAVFHPGNQKKFGGSWAVGEKYGVGLTPWKTNGMKPTSLLWGYHSWKNGRASIPIRWPVYIRKDGVPPRGAKTYSMGMRVSKNTHWKHLLKPYKTYFQETFGGLRYEPDHRYVTVMHANRNRESISESNPYGFHPGMNRLNERKAVESIVNELLPRMKKSNSLGVIIWGHYGHEPRGGMYRADFNVMPPPVRENLTYMGKKFEDAGVQWGVATRPGHVHLRKTWKRDGSYARALNSKQLNALVTRYKDLMDMGATLFYLDSFGNKMRDVKIVRYLRRKLGPDVHMYAEHGCDAIAPYSGFFAYTDFIGTEESGGPEGVTDPHYKMRTSLDFIKKVRWLLDADVPVITSQYEVRGEIPADFPSFHPWAFKHHLTPMVSDNDLDETSKTMRQFQKRYLKDGQWNRSREDE